MRRFCLQFTGFLALQLAVAGLLFAVCCAVYPPSESYYAAMPDKLRLLATQPEPRLIIVGDSSAAFGLDSRLIARRVGRHPVNLGLMAGLDMNWTLRHVEKGLRSGDVVLLQFIPIKFTEERARGETLLRVLLSDPKSLRTWDWPHVKDVLERGAHSFLASVTGVGARILASPRAVPEDGYLDVLRRVNLNADGDMMGHVGLPSRWNPGNVRPFVFDPKKATPTAHALQAFSKNCQARGITVFLVSAPIPHRSWDVSGKEIVSLHRWVTASSGLTSLNEPAANVWPDLEFFDSMAHPGKTLAGKHSEIVATRLEAALAASTALR